MAYRSNVPKQQGKTALPAMSKKGRKRKKKKVKTLYGSKGGKYSAPKGGKTLY